MYMSGMSTYLCTVTMNVFCVDDAGNHVYGQCTVDRSVKANNSRTAVYQAEHEAKKAAQLESPVGAHISVIKTEFVDLTGVRHTIEYAIGA